VSEAIVGIVIKEFITFAVATLEVTVSKSVVPFFEYASYTVEALEVALEASHLGCMVTGTPTANVGYSTARRSDRAVLMYLYDNRTAVSIGSSGLSIDSSVSVSVAYHFIR
jgi:hypothetical protein